MDRGDGSFTAQKGLLRCGCCALPHTSSHRNAAPEERGSCRDRVLGCRRRHDDAAWQRRANILGATCSAIGASEVLRLPRPLAAQDTACFEVGMCLCCPVSHIVAKQSKQLMLSLRRRCPCGVCIAVFGDGSLVERPFGRPSGARSCSGSHTCYNPRKLVAHWLPLLESLWTNLHGRPAYCISGRSG